LPDGGILWLPVSPGHSASKDVLRVEINLFMLTSMFNRIRALSPATMVAETASLVVGGSQYGTN
jgi:hypothetical protein